MNLHIIRYVTIIDLAKLGQHLVGRSLVERVRACWLVGAILLAVEGRQLCLGVAAGSVRTSEVFLAFHFTVAMDDEGVEFDHSGHSRVGAEVKTLHESLVGVDREMDVGPVTKGAVNHGLVRVDRVVQVEVALALGQAHTLQSVEEKQQGASRARSKAHIGEVVRIPVQEDMWELLGVVLDDVRLTDLTDPASPIAPQHNLGCV